MSEIIDTHAKKIIIFLMLIILILIMLCFMGAKDTAERPNVLPGLADKNTTKDRNILNLIALLNDPNENVHGVLLLAPDRHDKLVVLNGKLNQVKYCFSDPELILYPSEKPLEIPRECLSENIKVHLDRQQNIALTPATRMGKNGPESLLYISDYDHQVKCTRPDGDC